MGAVRDYVVSWSREFAGRIPLMLAVLGIALFRGSYKGHSLWDGRPVTGAGLFLAGVALWVGPRVVDFGE